MAEPSILRKRPSARARVSPSLASRAASAPPSLAESAPGSSLGTLPSARKDLAPFLGAMEELFEPQDLLRRAHVLGVVDRSRKKDLPLLVTATVLALTGPSGMQTNVRSLYHNMGGMRVALSSFYEWFYGPFCILMAELAQRAILAVQAVEKQRPELARPDGLLERLGDVAIVDSTSKLLGKLAHLWAPSTSEAHGGIKIHAITSLDSPIIQHYETTVQTTHDSKQLRADQFAPGILAMYDLGYVDHEREAAMNERGVLFLRRLKDSENPRIVKFVKLRTRATHKDVGFVMRSAMTDSSRDPSSISTRVSRR